MTCQEEIQRYKILLETARCFGRAMDLRTLIDDILNRSQEVMRAQACTLLLPDSDSGDLILHSTDPKLAARPEPLKLPAGQGFAGAVYRTRQTLNIADAQKDPRHYQRIGQQVGFVTRAIISIPLLDGANCLGVLQAMNPLDRQEFDAEDEEIFQGFGGLIVNALLRLDAQHRAIERAQAEQELLLAREIQESFLPSRQQEFPFARVHLCYSSAQLVGGDFYFVHPIGADRLLAGLGDVTGKGVPAALTMARATAMIQAMVTQLQDDLGQWVTKLNRQLSQDLSGGRFIAMTFLLADARRSLLQACAAGQFPPLRRTTSLTNRNSPQNSSASGAPPSHSIPGSWTQLPLAHHLPLGIRPDASYQSEQAPLLPGDLWMLFSDGITEARNLAGQELTVATLLAKLPTGLPGAATLAAAIQIRNDFVGPAPQHDDSSLLLLEWRGSAPPGELSTTCCPENLALGRAFFESWAKYAGYDDVAAGQIVLACDEAVSNIFRHGYGEKPGPLKFQAHLDTSCLSIQIFDQAHPVDTSKIRARDLADIRPGGLGTFIIAQVFDEVRYQPTPAGTVLTLRKKLP